MAQRRASGDRWCASWGWAALSDCGPDERTGGLRTRFRPFAFDQFPRGSIFARVDARLKTAEGGCDDRNRSAG